MAAPYEVLDGSGEAVASGRIGDAPSTLLQGTHALKVRTADGPLLVSEVEVEPGRLRLLELEKEGEEIGTRLRAETAGGSHEGSSRES